VHEHVTAGQVLGIGFTLASLGLFLRGHVAPAPAPAAAPARPPSDEEVAELPGIAAFGDPVVPADEGVHP
jgi:hypothetical protein